MITMTENKHDTLVDMVYKLLDTHGLQPERNVEYNRGGVCGEIDVLCNGIYYEVKGNYSKGNARKAYQQIIRAINTGMCHYGYMVTSQGIYDILDQDRNLLDSDVVDSDLELLVR